MKKRMLALLMTIVMSLSLLPMSALATEGETDVPDSPVDPTPTYVAQITTIEDGKSNTHQYETLDEAISEAKDGDTIILTAESVNIDKIVLDKSVTIQGTLDADGKPQNTIIVNAEKNRNNTGETYGFEIGDTAAGKTISFKDLAIQAEDETAYGVLQLIWIKNTNSAGVDVTVDHCTLTNVGAGGTYRHALSMEYASGNMTYYFDLTVTNSRLSARSYCFGSGLNNGNPDVSNCTAEFTGNVFNSYDTGSSIYNIHTPKAFKKLIVNNNTFASVRSGGIKYIYSTNNEVKITNNDFTDSNQEMISGVYAIMATTQTKDYSDARAYSYATELANNNLENQNTIIAVAALVEVVWFPDGQAINQINLNNYGNTNSTDKGTRYGLSQWGGNKKFIVLTDFNIETDLMTFRVNGAEKETTYFYNTKENSGAYTSAVDGFDSYFTDENPRHCTASLATWGEANAITRWTLGENSKTILLTSDDGIVMAEDTIAKIEVDTKTGKISVTPKQEGVTYLNAYVGSGTNDTNTTIGAIPNAKMDTLKIEVLPEVGSIVGTVFEDIGRDNKYVSKAEATENVQADKVFENITVELWQKGEKIAETTTNANGEYRFDELTPGQYEVRIPTTPDSVNRSCAIEDSDQGNKFKDNTTTVTVTANVETRANAGFYYKSNGGGGSTKPPVLNTEDHYGYIIGYPVDYYTGEKTNDQTRMPVKPEGNITRAEVATIFFRMLTDESRAEFWSQTSSYSDVEADDWFNNAICTLSNAGIINGYNDGTFKPNGKITRAEFATIASRFFEYADENIENPFSDVEEGAWYYKYIMAASEMGLINGYPDGTFGPEKLITRAEAVTIVNRTLDRHPDQDHFLKDMLVWVDNMDTSKWYYEAMQEATNSHEYEMKGSGDNKYENWTKMLPIRDWAAFEKEWSDANSASGGEVVK